MQTAHDTLDESDEDLSLVLSNPVNGTIAVGEATGEILDDDGPAVSINNASVAEGGTLTFTVSLSAASPQPVTFSYATANGTAEGDATGGLDFNTKQGTVTIPAGATSAQITVVTREDLLDEDDETLGVSLSNVLNGVIGTGLGTGTIIDNDLPPSLSVSNSTVTEGGVLQFNITLDKASGRAVTVRYTTADGSAYAPTDYTGKSGLATFPAGVTSVLVQLPTVNNTDATGSKEVGLLVYGAVNAAIVKQEGDGLILDDDGGGALPALPIQITQFYTNGTNLLIDYTVAAGFTSPFKIGLYASRDGVHVEEQLEVV